MPHIRNMLALASLAVLALGAETTRAAPDNARLLLHSQCFTPRALAAAPHERLIRKGDRRFDRPEAETPLAPYNAIASGLRGAVRRVELPKGSRKLVALTLDFCEQTGEVAGYDGAIIDHLRAANVPATLFLGGKWMRSHDERTRQLMSDPLFEIANHGSAHRNLRILDAKSLAAEILGPQRAYESIRGEFAKSQCAAPHIASVPPRLSLFRFPFGACNAASLAAVNDAGLLAIQWDVSTGDPTPMTSADAIVRQMTANVKPGSIVIAHANGRGYHTAAALPKAIAKLRQQGFEFVTVSALLAAGVPVISQTCYDSRPGDTDRYDNLFTVKPRLPLAPPRGQPGWAAETKR